MSRFRLVTASVIAAWFLVPPAARAAEEIVPMGSCVYVSAKGTPEGDGSQTKPLDITTAFSTRSPAKPGDTILLAGGAYEGAVKEIDRLPFELAVSGTAEKPVRIMPVRGAAVHLNGTLDVTGSHVWVVGLEIGDLAWDLHEKTRKNQASVMTGPSAGVRIINCNLFGGWCGIKSFSYAKDSLFYGCLIHDFGNWIGHKSAGGSGFYGQNGTGTKTISNCLAYRTASYGLAPHGQKGVVSGFDLTQNIAFLPGAVTADNQPWENLMITTADVMDRIRVVGNVFYYPSIKGKPVRCNAWMAGSRRSTLSKSGVFQDNYLAGGPTGLLAGRWEDFRATGNTVWATDVLVDLSLASPPPPAPATNAGLAPDKTAVPDQKPEYLKYNFSGNTYYLPERGKAFLIARPAKPTPEDIRSVFANNRSTLAEWRALGLDQDCKTLATRDGKPTGTQTFLFSNQYQPNRAHVGIFNWDHAKEADVEMAAALDRGVKYAIYNVLDIRQTVASAKPVLTGTYTGGRITFPLRQDPASPDFDAFLVMPAPE